MRILLRKLYYLLAVIFSKFVLLLPYHLAVYCGGRIGLLAYLLIGRARKVTLLQLRRSLPEIPDTAIRRIAREVFVNQGKNVFELFSFPKLKSEDIAAMAPIKNKDVLESAFKAGRGVLIASAHCGNWEYMGASLSLAGFPINVIARRIYIEGLNNMLVGFRTSKGVRVILRSGRESAKEILRSLRHNEAIGILIDQDTAVPGVFSDFFSRKAWTPSGLAALAARTGAAVVLALDVRRKDDIHEVILQGPITMRKTGDNEADISYNTQLVTSLIEDHVRRYPEQWVWMHERWKTQTV